MSKTLRLIVLSIVAVVCQTNLAGYLRVADVAPDMMIAFLVSITSFCGPYAGFCAGSLMAMLYDANVGYALAINLVLYTFIGWAAPMLRNSMNNLLKKMKHKSYLEIMLISLFLTLIHELVCIGYLFLIGAEQSAVTVLRALMCAGYSALITIPINPVVKKILTWHPVLKKKKADLADEDVEKTKRQGHIGG